MIIAENVKLNLGCRCHKPVLRSGRKTEVEAVSPAEHLRYGYLYLPARSVEIDPSVAQAYPVNTLLWPISPEQERFQLGRILLPAAVTGSEDESRSQKLAVGLSTLSTIRVRFLTQIRDMYKKYFL